MPRTQLTGTRIRDHRQALRLKQSDLAQKVGISPSYLNLIEHNRRGIAGKLLLDIANVLGVDPVLLSQGAQAQLLTALQDAALIQESQGIDPETAEDLTTRFPDWVRLILRQKNRIDALEQSVAALSDRLAHDSKLSESLHDILSVATAIRSTSSILVQSRDMESQQQARFQQNLDQDARRLADASLALAQYLDSDGANMAEILTPQDEFDTILAQHHYHFAPLEQMQDEETITTVLEQCFGETTDITRKMAHGFLRAYARDAADLGLAPLLDSLNRNGPDPARLARDLHRPLPLILRRMASLGQMGPQIGLIICDMSGALTRRQSLPDFALPQVGYACGLWPIFTAQSQPMRLSRQSLRQNDRLILSFSLCAPKSGQEFCATPVLESYMLLIANTEEGDNSQDIGTTCRLCRIPNCPARREPSVLE